ncbi:hypothetical protein T492DRAFT_1025382 [Pavlovales sp. CCMP2436]|nr:hypothetical protein T492DRAFT_1025382 [Pavlovales sp. CCMP2436]
MNELSGLGALFSDSEKSQREWQSSRAQITPGNVGELVAKAPSQPAKKEADANAIWEEAELDEDDGFDQDDGRATAGYEIVYRQRVSPQDMFLGIDPTRNPGTACCENLIIRIMLPETTGSELDLEVKRTRLTLRTPKHKLRIHLPKPVDDDHGNAKWISDKCCLEVTLPVLEDWDGMLGGGP